MDLKQLSQIAVAILTPLSPYLVKAGEAFAKGVGEEVFTRSKNLYTTIRGGFQQTGNTQAQNTLEQLDKASPTEKEQLIQNIVQRSEEDAEFARALTSQVEDMRTLLFDCLRDKFLVRDLKQVYFRLGIGWDDLVGGVVSRDEKAIALIEYVNARNRVPELIEAMWTVYPGLHC
jgi:predicted ArsR family transcriptional regulator